MERRRKRLQGEGKTSKVTGQTIRLSHSSGQIRFVAASLTGSRCKGAQLVARQRPQLGVRRKHVVR